MMLDKFVQDAAQFNLYRCIDVKEQILHYCYALESQIFKITDIISNKMTRIRVSNENWFFHKILGNGNRDGHMFSNPFCCTGVLETSFLRAS